MCKVEIQFTCQEPKYQMHYREYAAIWKEEGKKIIDAFEKIIGVEFTEKQINIIIGKGDSNGGNTAGMSISDPMLFRYNNRCKIGTLLHELSHRLIIEYDWYSKVQQRFGFYDVHQLVDLFLFEIIEELYGKDAAILRMQYESAFPEPEFSECWEYAMKFSKAERSEKLKEAVKYIKAGA